MPITLERAEQLKQSREPIHGWVKEERGWLTGPSRDPHITQDYSDHAEIQRSRWDLFHHIKTIFRINRRRAQENLPPADREGHFQKPGEKSSMLPTDTEIRFLKMIKAKDGGITIADALDFENQPGEIGFGPGLDALDILDKNIDLGIIEFSERDLRYTYKGFNHETGTTKSRG